MASRTSGRSGDRTFIQRSRPSSGKSPEQKAIYHQVAGAGKSRVLRKFFELSDADEVAIQQVLDRGLGARIDQAR